LEWLVCDPEGCIPGFAELRLALPVADVEPAVDAEADRRFDATAALVPRSLPPEAAVVQAIDGGLSIDILEPEVRAALASSASVVFFPERDGVVGRAGANLRDDGSVFLPRAQAAVAPGSRLTGVLVVGEPRSRRGFAIDTVVVAEFDAAGEEPADVRGAPVDPSSPTTPSAPLSWPISLALALLLLVAGVWSVRSGATARPRSEADPR
jgi:hypothetical protein